MVVSLHDIPGIHKDQIPFAAQAAADASNLVAEWTAPFTCRVKKVRLEFTDNITGVDTNSRNLNLLDNDRSTELANIDFVAGTNAAAGTEIDLYAPSAGKNLSEDDNLVLQSEKVGTGLATPEGVMIVEYEGR